MKLLNLKKDEQPLLMIIPMIDIIFFLLVFFMMSMLTMVTQRTIPLNLPATTTAQIDTTVTVPVSVNKEGRIFLELEEVSYDALANALAAKKAEHGEKLTIVLRGDQESPYGRVIEIMDLVKQTGISKLSIATDSPKK